MLERHGTGDFVAEIDIIFKKNLNSNSENNNQPSSLRCRHGLSFDAALFIVDLQTGLPFIINDYKYEFVNFFYLFFVFAIMRNKKNRHIIDLYVCFDLCLK